MRSSAEIDFNQRTSPRDLPELMDGDCSYEDFRGCLCSLEQINRWLLGYRPTLDWLNRLPHELRHPVHIVDVGSGGGDLLRQIAHWARRRGIAVQLTGIDLNPYAARAAGLLQWMEANARMGWFINDLERSERSCQMFELLDRIAGWHRFVRHDGPVSFRRAFRDEDWARLLTAAAVPQETVTVEHWWPGRLCVGRWK
jgi:SAM-dependent methyltransferase